MENSYSLIMDHAYFPYGRKSKEFLIKRSIYLCEFLFKFKKVSSIILACNTLSFVALPFLKCLYGDKITGVGDLFDFDEPDCALIGTKNTINYLIGIIECFDGQVLINKLELGIDCKDDIRMFCLSLSPQIKTLFLGCTHFILAKEEFNKYIPSLSQDDLYLKKKQN